MKKPFFSSSISQSILAVAVEDHTLDARPVNHGFRGGSEGAGEMNLTERFNELDPKQKKIVIWSLDRNHFSDSGHLPDTTLPDQILQKVFSAKRKPVKYSLSRT